MANIDWTLTWNTVLALSTTMMAAAIVATAVFAVQQLLSAGRTRCSELLMQLDKTWDSREYIQSRKMIYDYSYGITVEEASQKLKEALKTFDGRNTEEYFIMIRVANFFENLGFLACKGYLDKKDAWELFGSTSQSYWARFSAYVMYKREEQEPKQPTAWVYFEFLASEFTKYPDAQENS